MASGKNCVLCGDDCAFIPRVKDSHGNYYCKSCHEDAEAKSRERQALRDAGPRHDSGDAVFDEAMGLDEATPAEGAPAISDTPDDRDRGMMLDDNPALDDSEDDLRLDDSDDDMNLNAALRQAPAEAKTPAPKSAPEPRKTPEPKPEPEAKADPEPDAETKDLYDILEEPSAPSPRSMLLDEPLSDDAGLDDSDSFGMLGDVLDDQPDIAGPGDAMILEPMLEPPPVATMAPVAAMPTATATRPMIWPYVIGILALLVGGFATASSTIGLLGNLAARSQREFFEESIKDHVLVAVVTPAALIVFFGWKAVGGLGLLLKKPFGATALRYWARAIILTFVTIVLLIIGAMVVGSFGSGLSATQSGTAIGAVAAILAVGSTIMLIWPIFLVVWFRREKIQDDIASW